ncbi:MAG: glycoside hydrolase family 13 protein [Ignavibacteriaceae bacterium]
MKQIVSVIVLSIFVFGFCGNTPSTKKIPRVPEWAKTAVWYQIFPERFANGDKSNDPTPHDMEGAWPYLVPNDWQISPWTSDWFKLQPWEKADGHDFYWNNGVRRYGGDLQGVIEHLSYLKDLGITAIYFNPLFESPSHHKYDASMYHHIDNNFGPNPKEDERIWATENPGDPKTWKWTTADSMFLTLVKKCHNMGVKVIIDGVFNHVGTTFWAFKDVVKNQQASLYKDWFRIDSWDDPATPKNEFQYEGWNGVKDLPEIKRDPKYGLVKSFGEHVHSIVKRWMDPNGDGDPSDGIDGWRLDVAEKVPIKFWQAFRKWVKEVNPNAYITGEIWWEDWKKNEIFNASPWLQGDTFDGIMNYKFARAINTFIADQKEQISPEVFADSISVLAKDYNKDNLYALQNLLDSHDVDRIASQIVNPDRWYDHQASAKDNKKYDERKPNETEKMKQQLAVAIQMTMPGAPMVYYGDETGMWGGDDPDCRKPMVWKGLNYETESVDPLGRQRPADPVKFDIVLFNCYKKLISIRENYRALSVGDLNFFLIDNPNKILGYNRTLNGKAFYIIINNKSANADLSFDLSKGSIQGQLKDMLSGKIIKGSHNKYKLQLPGYGVAILQ